MKNPLLLLLITFTLNQSAFAEEPKIHIVCPGATFTYFTQDDSWEGNVTDDNSIAPYEGNEHDYDKHKRLDGRVHRIPFYCVTNIVQARTMEYVYGTDQTCTFNWNIKSPAYHCTVVVQKPNPVTCSLMPVIAETYHFTEACSVQKQSKIKFR